MPSMDLPMDTSEWKYTGWSPSIVMATSNATYTATRTKQIYTVVWQDTEGEVLKEEELQYGVMPSYELPKDTEKWTYIGWDPVVSMVTKDVVYTAIRESKIYKLKNQVLVDNEKFKIVILEASEDIFSLFTVTFYLENKTENQDLVFFVSDAVVNGYVSGAWLAHILEPKTNKTEKMWFDTTAMGKIGITTFDKIELYTTVSDGDDNSIPDLLNEIFTIYPTGLSENEIVVPNRPTTAHEKVIADNSMMTLIFIDTYEDEIMGDYILQMYLENKTTDKKLAYDLDYAVINGYFIYSFWGPGLQPKTKQVSEVCLSLEDIEFAGISSVDKIELYFRVYDSDDFWGPNLLEEKITLYPTGLMENEIIVPPRPTNENEYVVVSNEQVTFIIIDSYMDEYSNYIVELYFENKTDTPIIFDWNDVLVNELAIDPYFFMDIPQKTKGVRIVRFYSNDLRENNITKVETIKFLLDIYDKETWDTIFIETHTYNVPQAE